MVAIEGVRGFVERRLVGQTFVEAMSQYGTSHGGVDLSRIPLGDDKDRFEKVSISRISDDLQHALAYGQDRGRTTLLRDGEPLLTVDGSRLCVEAANDDFSRILVMDTPAGRGREVYLISGGEAVNIMPGYDVNIVGHASNLDWVIDSRYIPGNKATTFSIIGERENRDLFVVPGGFSSPRLVGASPDFSRVIWTGKKHNVLGGVSGDTYIFERDKTWGKAYGVYAFINGDVSRALVVLKDGRTPWTVGVRVVIDGQEVYRRKGLYFRRVEVTPDLSVAAIDVGYDYINQCGKLIIVRPGQQLVHSDRYDKLNSLEKTGDGLRAVVTRDANMQSIQYEILIPAK